MNKAKRDTGLIEVTYIDVDHHTDNLSPVSNNLITRDVVNGYRVGDTLVLSKQGRCQIVSIKEDVSDASPGIVVVIKRMPE